MLDMQTLLHCMEPLPCIRRPSELQVSLTSFLQDILTGCSQYITLKFCYASFLLHLYLCLLPPLWEIKDQLMEATLNASKRERVIPISCLVFEADVIEHYLRSWV